MTTRRNFIKTGAFSMAGLLVGHNALPEQTVF